MNVLSKMELYVILQQIVLIWLDPIAVNVKMAIQVMATIVIQLKRVHAHVANG